jgi:hypothetical protein
MDTGGPGDGTREDPGSPTSAGLACPERSRRALGGVWGHDDSGMLAPQDARIQCKHAAAARGMKRVALYPD